MHWNSLPIAVNCSMMFTELPILQRPAAARVAGFDAVEFWWPWSTPVPDKREVDAFADAIEDADVRLVGLNFFAGDLAGADCGAVSVPDLGQAFRDSVAVVVALGGRLGTRGFNALYGNRLEGLSPAIQDELALDNLRVAANAVGQIGGGVLIEAVSGPKPYPLRKAADAIRVIEVLRQSGTENVGLLLDLYHLASNGDDVEAVIERHHADVAHVQFADNPGRGEPGTGRLPLDRHLRRLHDLGYDGYAAAEYKPTTTSTADSLSWLSPRSAASSADTH